jgi:hypothetical protein
MTIVQNRHMPVEGTHELRMENGPWPHNTETHTVRLIWVLDQDAAAARRITRF